VSTTSIEETRKELVQASNVFAFFPTDEESIRKVLDGTGAVGAVGQIALIVGKYNRVLKKKLKP